MKRSAQKLFQCDLPIYEGTSTATIESAIKAGGGALLTNTGIMCRPFCRSGAGNPIIASKRQPIPGYEWDELWFGYPNFTDEEDFLRKHGIFGAGRCYLAINHGDERALVALADAIAATSQIMIGPVLTQLGHSMGRYSKFFINEGRLPHHTHDVKEEAYWIEPAMIPDYELFGERCVMTLGLRKGFGKEQLRAYLTREGWDNPDNVLKRHARLVLMHPGKAMIMPAQVLHGPSAFLPHYEPQYLDDGYRMYEPMPKIPRELLTTREIPARLKGASEDALLDYLVSDEALRWDLIHDAEFEDRHTCVPLVDEKTSGDGVTDTWIIYGAFGRDNNLRVFSCKRLVLKPGARYKMKDPVGSDMIVVQGGGKVGNHMAFAPRAIIPGQINNFSFIIPYTTANELVIENTGNGDMVLLRTFGSDHTGMPVLPWQSTEGLIPKPKAAA